MASFYCQYCGNQIADGYETYHLCLPLAKWRIAKLEATLAELLMDKYPKDRWPLALEALEDGNFYIAARALRGEVFDYRKLSEGDNGDT